jgi:hypothetical protein
MHKQAYIDIMKTLKKFQSKFNKDLKQKSQKQSNYTHQLNLCFWKTLHRCIPIDRVWQDTLTGWTDVSGRHYTGAFPLTECDKMCSSVKPVIKLKMSVHSNREHFFWTLTSSVHRLNRCNSKRSLVDLQRLVQKLRKCTHRLNRR